MYELTRITLIDKEYTARLNVQTGEVHILIPYGPEGTWTWMETREPEDANKS